MPQLHDFTHVFIVSFGSLINAISFVVICLKTQPAMKEYSVLLLNTSIVEFLSVFCHFSVDNRLIFHSPAIFCVSSGPCLRISENFCSITTAFLHVNMMHSLSILALSFWYRTRILLGKGPIGKINLQCLILVLFSPHIINIVGYLAMLSPRSDLSAIYDIFYGDMSKTTYGVQGFLDITEVGPSLLSGYLVVCPAMVNVYVLYARQKLIRILRNKVRSMSIKTSGLHASVVKVLTTHSALIVAVYMLLGALAAAQVVFGVRSPNIEHAVYDVAIIPALANPVLTLYFVRSYKIFIKQCLIRIICCVRPIPALVQTTTSGMQRKLDLV